MIEYIDSLNDSRLDVFMRLTEVQLRNKLEPEKGIFIAESNKVISRALNANYEPLSLLIPDHKLALMQSLIERINAINPVIPVFVAPAQEIKNLTGYELTRGILCAFRRKPLVSVKELLMGAKRIAVLENITNHTNIGALFRSAAALNIDAIILNQGCCDPLYRRAIRVSMGTVFQVPWTRVGEDPRAVKVDDILTENSEETSSDKERQTPSSYTYQGDALRWPHEALVRLKELGFTTAALALNDNSVALDDPRLKASEKLALLFGTEGEGLSHQTLEECDYVVKIPMAHGVDSLNVAAASAVTFWELRR